MPNDDFSDPFITCCFISDTELFINFFHNYSRTHYHFIWDFKNRVIKGENGNTLV